MSTTWGEGIEDVSRPERETPVDSLVMCGDRRLIADSITQVVAEGMHYFDKVDTVNLQTCSYTDVMELCKGWEDRYRSDPKFHAKVQSMVANLLRVLFT